MYGGIVRGDKELVPSRIQRQTNDDIWCEYCEDLRHQCRWNIDEHQAFAVPKLSGCAYGCWFCKSKRRIKRSPFPDGQH